MGVPGLLKLLKGITFPAHISKYENQIVGIDAYGWYFRILMFLISDHYKIGFIEVHILVIWN